MADSPAPGDRKPGGKADPGAPGTGENLCPACAGTGAVTEPIGGA